MSTPSGQSVVDTIANAAAIQTARGQSQPSDRANADKARERALKNVSFSEAKEAQRPNPLMEPNTESPTRGSSLNVVTSPMSARLSEMSELSDEEQMQTDQDVQFMHHTSWKPSPMSAAVNDVPAEQGLQDKPKARAFVGLKVLSSLVVSGLNDNGPAQKAGVRIHDKVLAVDGQRVTLLKSFLSLLGEKFAGDRVTLALERKGERVEVVLLLEEVPTVWSTEQDKEDRERTVKKIMIEEKARRSKQPGFPVDDEALFDQYDSALHRLGYPDRFDLMGYRHLHNVMCDQCGLPPNITDVIDGEFIRIAEGRHSVPLSELQTPFLSHYSTEHKVRVNPLKLLGERSGSGGK